MTLDDYAAAVIGHDVDTSDFATHSFIRLGGDSLRAMRLAALAQTRLGARIPVAALLGEEPLARVLASTAATVRPPDAPAGPAGPVRDDALPTRAQQGIWIAERIVGGSPYNLVFIAFAEGPLRGETLDEAVRVTVARHDGLCTVFRERDGSVVREVRAGHVPEITVVSRDGEEGFEDHVRRVAAEYGRRPFDLAAAPALRFLRVSHPAGRHALVVAAHHMVLDGWAAGLLLREIFARYDQLAHGAPDAEPGPGVSVAALSRHQAELRASGEWDRQTGFWRQYLDGTPFVLDLPADRPRPGVQDPAGARLPLDLGTAVSARVAERARELGITPFAFLLGAFGLTLSRWTGVRGLLVGVPVNGRGTPELEELVALAGNLIPVRVDIDDDATVAAFLRSVHGSLTPAIDGGTLPFDELVARLGIARTPGCHPLVQVSFGMHDQLVPERLATRTAGVRVEEAHGGGSQFDLCLLIGRSEPSFAGTLEYATAVWSRAEAAGFAADFRAAAAELAEAPAAALEQIRCIAPARRSRLDAINETPQDLPASSVDGSFREVARRVPDVTAVRDGSRELTYAQLARAAAQQARLLREAGVRPGDTVLIGLGRSIAEVVGVLGILWAGAAYVGVDLSQPAARNDRIAAKAAPAAALLTPGPAAQRLAAGGLALVPYWDPSWPGAEVADVPDAGLDPERRAYVAFTSGSTGEPKGVAVPHRAVLHLVDGACFTGLDAGERMLRLSPLAFDASTLEIFGTVLTGATMEVYPPGLPGPTELGAFLIERGVTVAWLTAGFFRLIAEFAPESLGGLRRLVSGGDVVPHDHVARVLTRNPGLTFVNGYGPTENTTFTTFHTVTRPEDVDGPLPIGVPLPGTRVHVLDDRRRRVPPGGIGELYAAGAGLALGYVADEAETARCFGRLSPEVPERLYRTGDIVRIDTQGRIRYLGRGDDQVKVRGFRIEMAEISAALTAHPHVKDAIVAVTDGDSSEKRLLAAVVPAAGADVEPAVLRDFLSERLPAFMVPALWTVVERIPVTGNGKVDRSALAAIAGPVGRPPSGRPSEQEAREPAADGVRAQLTSLFADAAGRTDLDDDADFFASGGDSLRAVRLVGLVNERLGVAIRLRDFLLAPTLAGLLRTVERASERAAGRAASR